MRHQSSTSRSQCGKALGQLGKAEGSGSIELVVWLALVALPMLGIVVAAVRFETSLAASQAIARELAREASLGRAYQAALADLAADFGLAPSQVDARVACVAGGGIDCELVRASVRIGSGPAIEVVMPMQSPNLGTLQ